MPNFLHKMADKIAGTSTTSHSTKSAVVEPAPGSTVGGAGQTPATTTASTRGDSYAPGSPGGGISQDRTASSKSSDLAGTSKPGGEERFKYDPSKGVVGSTHDSSSDSRSTGVTSSGTDTAPTESSDSTRRTSTDTKIAEGVSSRGGGLTGGVDEQHFDAGSQTAGSTGTSSSTMSHIGDIVKEGGSVQDALKGGQGEKVRHETEPIVREHVHDEYMHVNRTRIDEIHQKTHIIQIIQPIKDTVVEGMTRERVDEGTEVKHHNYEGVDKTEQQLAQAREEYIKSMSRGEAHDERHYETTEEPIIRRMDRVNVVEQVVPVFESELQGSRGAQSQHTTTSGSTTRTDYGPYTGGSSGGASSNATSQQQDQELVGVVPVVAKPSDTTTATGTTSTSTTTTTGSDSSNDSHIKQL